MGLKIKLLEQYLPLGSLRLRLVNALSWMILGNSAAQVFSLISSFLCGRILDPHGFGELGLIRSTFLMFGVFGGTGIGIAATKYVAEFRNISLTKVGHAIGFMLTLAGALGIFVTLICLLFAEALAEHVMNDGRLSSGIIIGAPLIAFSAINGVQLGALCGLELYKRVSQIIILDALLLLILIPFGAEVHGVNGALYGALVCALLGTLYKQKIIINESKLIGINITYCKIENNYKTLYKLVLPSILVGIFAQPFEWLARVIVVTKSGSYEALGIFTAAFTLSQIITFLPQQMAGPTISILPSLNPAKDLKKIYKILFGYNSLVIGITVLIGVFFVMLAPLLMSGYGKNYYASLDVYGYLAISTVLCAGSQIPKNYLYASNVVWIVVLAHVVMAFVLCGVCYWLDGDGSLILAKAYAFGWAALFMVEYIYIFIKLKLDCKSDV